MCQINLNASYDFLFTGKVDGTNSVFVYPPSATYRDYQNVAATVNFLDEASDEERSNAENICGIGNTPCIFDRVFTGRDDIAFETKGDVEKQNDTRDMIGNLFSLSHMDYLNSCRRKHMFYCD